MAEETKDVAAESSEKKEVRPAYDTSVYDGYSNNSEVILGESEVGIAFLHDIGFLGGPQKPVARIVMTHSVFLEFVSYCNTRAKLIQDGYGGKIPTLNTLERSDEQFKQSVENMQSRKKVVANFEFAEDES